MTPDYGKYENLLESYYEEYWRRKKIPKKEKVRRK